ncbi:phage holin family protein [Schauerella aestuarii]|uniref:phage holin family protein n=1 Tax=Schauerella aestuarii TaxID=2511204 RepID=UPI00136FB52B|nr:phage holin family protein [Achromobacter aestuarii]MYZ44042.1 phage holin family protein [Achromobacter aestuarii]
MTAASNIHQMPVNTSTSPRNCGHAMCLQIRSQRSRIDGELTNSTGRTGAVHSGGQYKMVFRRLNRAKQVALFAGNRVAEYIELFTLEFALYRTALITTLAAYIAMVFCAIFAAAFLSVAILVSYWGTDHRVTAAWVIFGVWCLLSIIAFVIAKRAAPDSAPQSALSEQLKMDMETIRGNYGHADRAHEKE